MHNHCLRDLLLFHAWAQGTCAETRPSVTASQPPNSPFLLYFNIYLNSLIVKEESKLQHNIKNVNLYKKGRKTTTPKQKTSHYICGGYTHLHRKRATDLTVTVGRRQSCGGVHFVQGRKACVALLKVNENKNCKMKELFWNGRGSP